MQTVRQTEKRIFKNVQNVRIRRWGPTLSGLAVVPFLPYLFDKPIEHATERIWKVIEEKVAAQVKPGVPDLKKGEL